MRTVSTSFIGIALLALSAFGLPAIAAGPVPAASLPGGALVGDDDPGNGEAWGRTGGRTFSYSDFVLANFSELRWQALSAGMSFNGPVDELGETMTLVSLSTDTAVFSGNTTVDLEVGGSRNIQTRFTIRLSGAIFGAVSPTVDVLTYSDFAVNVLFEAEIPDSPGTFAPALEVYDALPTSSTTEELANTTFVQGFFFEEAAGGLSLTEHDANMQGRADEIFGLLDFLRIETINRLTDINAAAGEHNENTSNRLNTIAETTEENRQKLLELLGDGSGDTTLIAIQNLASDNNQKLMSLLIDLQSLRDSVQNLPDRQDFSSLANSQQTAISIIACMWIGVLCDQVEGLPPGLPNIVGLDLQLEEIIAGIDWAKQDLAAVREDLQAIADELAAMNSGSAAIDLDVVSSKGGKGHSRLLLVLSKVDGVPTTSSLSVLAAPDDKEGFSLVPVAVSSVELAPGVQQLTIDLQGDLKKADTFLISAERVLEDGTVQHGSTLSGKKDTAD